MHEISQGMWRILSFLLLLDVCAAVCEREEYQHHAPYNFWVGIVSSDTNREYTFRPKTPGSCSSRELQECNEKRVFGDEFLIGENFTLNWVNLTCTTTAGVLCRANINLQFPPWSNNLAGGPVDKWRRFYGENGIEMCLPTECPPELEHMPEQSEKTTKFFVNFNWKRFGNGREKLTLKYDARYTDLGQGVACTLDWS